MNILDFPDVPLPDGDWLTAIFKGQQGLINRYHDIEKENGAVVVDPEDYGDIDLRHVQIRIKDLMQRTIEEMMEAANTLKNKPWKNTPMTTDKMHYYEELADALHFFIELCITSGLTAETLTKMYLQKHKVNEFRQESNY